MVVGDGDETEPALVLRLTAELVADSVTTEGEMEPVVFATSINGVGLILPSQLANPTKAWKESFAESRKADSITLAGLEREKGVMSVIGGPDVVMQLPLKRKSLVTEYAVTVTPIALHFRHGR